MTEPGRTARTERESWNIDTIGARLHSFVFGEEIADMADERDDIVMLTADLETSNRTGEFHTRHPDRFFEIGIAEQNMMSIAAGMSTCGLVPYVSTFASFASLLCAEHLRTDLAYPRRKVRVLAHHAGIAMGFYGTSHHATEDIALTRAIAGLTVVSPCDANSTRALLRATVDTDGPVYVRLGRGSEREVHPDVPVVERGRLIPLRQGTDVSILATGLGVSAAVDAATKLAANGVSAAVYDVAWLKPIHEPDVVAAAATGNVVTVEEHNVVGGLGSAVAEILARHRVDAALAIHGLPDGYVLVGPPTHLYRHYGLTGDGVAAVVGRLLGRDPGA